MIGAWMIVGLAVWQSIQIFGVGELSLVKSVNTQLKPTNTHTDRVHQSRRNRITKEPVAAFFERAKRGMTEQEIRWMIADFEEIGPMPTSGDLAESQQRAKKLQEWHIKALSEALSLSHEQKREVWDSLNPLRDRQPLEWKPEQYLTRNFYFANSYADSWSHCNLTEDQAKLTYKKSLEARYEARWEEDKKSGSISCHVEQLLIMHDPATGGYIDYPPPSTLDLACTKPGTIKGWIIDVTNTFPLTPDQKLESHRDDLLAQAKLLHPAQLRMALMMKPSLFQAIKYELDKLQE